MKQKTDTQGYNGDRRDNEIGDSEYLWRDLYTRATSGRGKPRSKRNHATLLVGCYDVQSDEEERR